MALFMADDVRTLPRKDGPPGRRTVEEVERAAVVKRVEVFALVEQQVESLARLPGRASREHLAPKGRAARRRLGRGPITELRSTRRVAARRRRADSRDCKLQRGQRQIRDRPQLG